MKYFSMFSGIGGFEYGMDQSDIEFKCVGFAEVDKYAKSIYSRHFPRHKNFGDVTEIRTEELPDFEFLVGGFPCQAFSNAGKRGGFNDARGTLFFEIARILKDKRPKYFLLENVRGLLHHDNGKTFKRILEVLSSLGYNVKWEIFNSKDFVPQNRERIFIKGYSRRECGTEVLHFRRENEKSCDETNIRKIERIGNFSPSNHYGNDVFSSDGLTSAICGSSVVKNGLHIQKPLKIRESTKKGYKDGYPYDGVLLNRAKRKIARGIVRKNHCGALQTDGAWGVIDPKFQIRKLTPIECERLQGFPDDWTKFGVDGEEISDTQRYKCLGNAVTTDVITYIMNEMFEDVE